MPARIGKQAKRHKERDIMPVIQTGDFSAFPIPEAVSGQAVAAKAADGARVAG
jgi:hypothetical protein